MEIEIEEFILEVRENLCCYEDAGKQMADRWEKEFRQWLKRETGKNKKSLRERKGRLYYIYRDEDEIMEAADAYYDAVSMNGVREYWKTFA